MEYGRRFGEESFCGRNKIDLHTRTIIEMEEIKFRKRLFFIEM